MAQIHLAELIHRQAEKYGEKTALRYRDDETRTWKPVSWTRFASLVRQTAGAMAAAGIEEQENVGIFSPNKPECLYVDFAAYANRAVTVPLYDTSAMTQVQYIVDDAQIRFLFVGGQYQYDTAFRVFALCRSLRCLVIFDQDVIRDARDTTSVYFDEFLERAVREPSYNIVDARAKCASPDDLANILYTSGTTGEPKGVMLHHANYLEAFRIHRLRLPQITDSDVSMCFLPLTHVFERGWTYVCIERGVEICINRRPQDIQTTIREVRPTVMCSVPRFWEKVYQAVQERLAEETGLRKAMLLDAIRIGKEHNLGFIAQGKTPPLALRLRYKFYEKTVYALVKKTIGIERGRLFPTAGAAVSDEICEFVHALGINMIVGYGLTESTATVSCFPKTGFVIGSVGEIMPDLEVKIGRDDEILLRGKTIMRGYYRKPVSTSEAIDAEGWFHTGDAGRLEGRTLYLKERIKDLFKTSNGKYISPQALETKFIVDRYIDSVAIIADRRKFVTALIVPAFDLLENFARTQGIAFSSREELVANDAVLAFYRFRIDTLQQQFAHYEQVKRFTLLPSPFSMERGELTNTLKLRRNVIAANYADIIENMYKE